MLIGSIFSFSERFKLLITTRQRRLDTNFVDIPLDVLSEDEALSLLRGILGENDKQKITLM